MKYRFKRNFFEKPQKARNFVKIRLHYFCTILYGKSGTNMCVSLVQCRPYLNIYLCKQLKGDVYQLFAPVPCSASINKSSAYHFGPFHVRILLRHYRVMADAQAPVEAAVPTAQALV